MIHMWNLNWIGFIWQCIHQFFILSNIFTNTYESISLHNNIKFCNKTVYFVCCIVISSLIVSKLNIDRSPLQLSSLSFRNCCRSVKLIATSGAKNYTVSKSTDLYCRWKLLFLCVSSMFCFFRLLREYVSTVSWLIYLIMMDN